MYEMAQELHGSFERHFKFGTFMQSIQSRQWIEDKRFDVQIQSLLIVEPALLILTFDQQAQAFSRVFA